MRSHRVRESLNDGKLKSWFKNTGKDIKTNVSGTVKQATGSVEGALKVLEKPTITVSIDDKTKNTIITSVSILSIGILASALLRKR